MSKKKYPDLLPSPGSLVPITRHPRMEADDKRGRKKKRIHWGEDYMRWSVEKKLEFAENLAATMNNAADILQQERKSMISLAEKQEILIVDWQKKYDQQVDIMTLMTIRSNEEKQSRLIEMQELKATIRTQKKRIEELEIK